MIDINKLEERIDKILAGETSESLTNWLNEKRSYENKWSSITLKERILGVLKNHSIEKVEDWSHIIEERDWDELVDNLISCFKQFGNSK